LDRRGKLVGKTGPREGMGGKREAKKRYMRPYDGLQASRGKRAVHSRKNKKEVHWTPRA